MNRSMDEFNAKAMCALISMMIGQGYPEADESIRFVQKMLIENTPLLEVLNAINDRIKKINEEGAEVHKKGEEKVVEQKAVTLKILYMIMDMVMDYIDQTCPNEFNIVIIRPII